MEPTSRPAAPRRGLDNTEVAMELRDYLRGLRGTGSPSSDDPRRRRRRHTAGRPADAGLRGDAVGLASPRRPGRGLGTSTLGDSTVRQVEGAHLPRDRRHGARRRTARSRSSGSTRRPSELVMRIRSTNPAGHRRSSRSAREGPTPEEPRALAEAWIDALKVEIDDIEGDGTPGSAPVTILPGDEASCPTHRSSPTCRRP